MQIKHIYWFAYFNMFSPSVRYRAKYPLDLFNQKHEISYSFIFPSYNPKYILRFLIGYFFALFFRKKDSLIVIQRVHTHFIYSTALKTLIFFQKKNTLYDLDDAEYFDRPAGTINYFLKNCETCSVGSNAVKEYALKFNSNVLLLTSPVISHAISKQKRNAIFTIGWIGDFGGSHRESLFQLFFPAIKDSNFRIKLVILGIRQEIHREEVENYFSENKNIHVEIPSNIHWQNELSVYNRVKEFDVGICPLVDNEITRAKSAFKIKQYFSCGIPALGSDIGENGRFIKHGINGFLCNTVEEFREAVLQIKNLNDEDYSSLCIEAKKCVNQFDMEHYCSTILQYYK